MSQLTRIAVRNVTRNARRSVLTAFAVFMGVALVGSLKGLTNGFIELQVRNCVEGQTGALQVHRTGYLDNMEGAPLELSMPYSPELLAKMRSVSGVQAVTGRIQFSGLVNNGISQALYAARGLDLATELQVAPRSGMDIEPGGRPLKPGDYRDALVGEELAESLNAVAEGEKAASQPRNGVHLTDTLTLNSTSPEGRSNSLSVKVRGRIHSQVFSLDKRILTVPLELAQDLLNMKGKVTEYAIAVDRLEHLDRIAADLRIQLGPSYEVSTWIDLQPDIKSRIERMGPVMVGLTALLLIIALTGIINTMMMSVHERFREIGTMLAVGVRKSQVLVLFLYEATALGVLGGTCGAALAELAVFFAHRRGIPIPSGTGEADRLLPVVSIQYLAAAVAFSAVAALLAALYPAWRASKLNPVDALRSV